MSPNPRFLTVPLALLLVAGPGSFDAYAATLNWKTAVSGNAGVAGNWNPAQVPQSGDMATFNVGGAYTVTFDATADTTSDHVYRSGAVTLVANHRVNNTLRVGDLAGDAATMSLTTGALAVGSGINVGNASGSTGTLNVNDDDADLVQTGTTADVSVGVLGNGTLNVTGGGLVDAADDVIVGAANGSQGTLLVSGVNASPVVRSVVSSSGADGDLVFGSNGTATVNITGGAQALAADDVRMALTSTSNSNATVEGAGSAQGSLLAVTGDLDIASNRILGLASGTASLLVQNSGAVTVGGTTLIGDAEGGTGTLGIRPSAFFTTHALDCIDGHSVLDFQGGNLTVDGGVFNPPGTTLVLDHVQFERVTMRNGATATFDGGSSVGYSLILGETEEGGLNLETGAHLTHTNGVFSLAVGSSSVGVLNMSGAALLDGTGTLVVGQGGNGEFNLSGGADVNLTHMDAAYSPGSNTFVNVQGSGTTLTVQQLDIGGHVTSAGGNGGVFVGTGGIINTTASGGTSLRVVNPNAVFHIQAGGTVNAANNFDNHGRLLMSGGVLNVGSLNFQPGGTLVGNGVVNGNVAVFDTNAVIQARQPGSLTLGNASASKGFSNAGTLIADTAGVTIRDLDTVSLGNVVLHSGWITLNSGVATVPLGKSLTGSGSFTGNLAIAGLISPGDAAYPRGAYGVNGSYTQTSTGKLVMEIGDAPSLNFDRIQVTGAGAVTLGGALDIKLLPGFTPNPGEDFTLMTFASRTGTFSTVTYNGGPVSGQFTMIYSGTSVVLHVNAITVDVPSQSALPHELSFVGRSGSDAGFELALPEASRVVVRLYSVDGRIVGTLFEGQLDAGFRRVRLRDLDRRLPGGVYFGRATVNQATRVAKVVFAD